MRLLFIRHGDPDYEHDSLTEKGFREAELLVPRLTKEKIDRFYLSPLGRAQATARPTLEALGAEGETLPWLREFGAVLDVTGSELLTKAYPDTRENGKRIVWDMLPGYWRNESAYYGRDSWRDTPVARSSDYSAEYDRVTAEFDKLLASHGYERSGSMYITKQGSGQTLAFFCHFGVTCMLLSHLFGVSPHILVHCLAAAPTSVTELYSEEREKGKVIFRASRIGDISHLYAQGEPPAFSARFCEVYENDFERH